MSPYFQLFQKTVILTFLPQIIINQKNLSQRQKHVSIILKFTSLIGCSQILAAIILVFCYYQYF